MSSLASRDWARALVAAALVAGVLHALSYWYVTSDDAFISLRYARNLARGDGLVYNPGESAVEGFSNPLFTLTAALLLRLGVAPLVAVKLVGLASLAAASLAAAALARLLAGPDGRVAGASAAALVAGSSYVALWSVAGLETMFYAALVTGATLAAVRDLAGGRARAAPLLFVAVAATRPEGAMLAAAAAGSQWLLARCSAALVKDWTLRFALPSMALLAARFAYYGALVPNTAQAKVFFGAESIAFGASYLASFFAEGGVWIVAPLVGLLWRPRALSPGVLIAIAVVATQCAFVVAVGADYMPGYRFLVPVYPLACCLAAVALSRVGGALVPAGRADAAVFTVASMMAVAAWLAQHAAMVESPRRFWLVRERPSAWYVGTSRLDGTWLAAHAAAGDYVAEHARPGDAVVVTEAGVIPFHADIETIDLLGLNEREIAALWREENAEQRATADDGLPQARYWGVDIAAYALRDAPRWIVLDGHLDANGRLVPRLGISAWVMRHPDFGLYRRVFSAKVYDGAATGLGADRFDVVFERQPQ